MIFCCELVNFCDYVNILHKIASSKDVITLQKDLDAIARWAADWRLDLNVSKCKTFNYNPFKRKVY